MRELFDAFGEQRMARTGQCSCGQAAQYVGDLRADADGNIGKQGEAGAFRHGGGVDVCPERADVVETLRDQEGAGEIGKRAAFLFGQLKGVDKAEPVDDAVGDLSRDDFPRERMRGDRVRFLLLHGRG